MEMFNIAEASDSWRNINNPDDTGIVPVKWLLQEDIFDEKIEVLAQEIEKQMMEYKIVKYIPFKKNEYYVFKNRECVISYGSVNFIKNIRNKNWMPNIWLSEIRLECTTYYSFYGKYLLNQNYSILSYSEFKRKRLKWQSPERDVEIFIRPNSVMKTFNGQVLQYNESVEDHCYEPIYPDTLVVVAPYKNIQTEWRFIVVGKNVITGCQYRKNGKLCTSTYVPPEALTFVRDMIKDTDWFPLLVFVADIGISDGVYGLIELGSFNCAGLYECSIPLIVEAVSEMAIDQYKSFHNI